MSTGKGDKLRLYNSKIWRENYDSIEWREKGMYCCCCGIKILKENIRIHPYLYFIYDDGHVECKNCNFN